MAVTRNKRSRYRPVKSQERNQASKRWLKIAAADRIVVVMKLWKHGGAKGLACLFS